MNDYITYCARAKLLDIVKSSPGCVGVEVKTYKHGGFEIDTVFNRSTSDGIIISMYPLVVTNRLTLNQLTSGSIDFSYKHNEFVITRSPSVIYSNP